MKLTTTTMMQQTLNKEDRQLTVQSALHRRKLIYEQTTWRKLWRGESSSSRRW